MKLKRNLSVFILTSFIVLFFGSFVFAEDTITIQELNQLKEKAQKYDENVSQYNEFKFQKDLINQVVSSNLTYLGVTVTALLAINGTLGGLFIFFNFKPLKDNLLKTEGQLLKTKEEILNIKEEIKNEISDLNIKISSDLDVQFQIAKNSIMELEERLNKKISIDFNKIKEDYEHNIYSVTAEVYRSMGMILERDKSYDSASLWFSRAAYEANEGMSNKSYIKFIDDVLLNTIKRNLNNILKDSVSYVLNYEIFDEIVKNISALTDNDYKDSIDDVINLIDKIKKTKNKMPA